MFSLRNQCLTSDVWIHLDNKNNCRTIPKYSRNIQNTKWIFTFRLNFRILERNWKIIRDEALAIIDKDKNSFPLETEDLLDTGDWRQFDLYSQGQKKANNCAKVPKTCALLDKIPDATGNKRGQVSKISYLNAQDLCFSGWFKTSASVTKG